MKRLIFFVLLALNALYGVSFGTQGSDPIHRTIPGNRANFLPESNNDAPVSHWHDVITGPIDSASVDVDRVRQELDHAIRQRKTTLQNIERLRRFVSQARNRIARFKRYVQAVNHQIADCRIMEQDYEIRGLGSSRDAQEQVNKCYRDARSRINDRGVLVRQASRLYGLITQASQKVEILTGAVEHRLGPRIRSLRAELEYLQSDVEDVRDLLQGGAR